MYEATKSEREVLLKDGPYLTTKLIDLMDDASEDVRKGIPVDFGIALAVIAYQEELQKIRKSQNRWWQFWK